MNAATNVLFKNILKKTQTALKQAAKPAVPKPTVVVEQIQVQTSKFQPRIRSGQANIEFSLKTDSTPLSNIRSSQSQSFAPQMRAEPRLFNNGAPFEVNFQSGRNFSKDVVSNGRNFNVNEAGLDVAEAGLFSH